MAPRDYYEVLGVSRNASQDELKAAFRQLARTYHPDVSQDPHAEERFKEVNEAYGVLSDQQKRAAYDRFGHAGVQGNGAPDFSTVDFSDIFEEFFGFGGFGRSSQRSRNTPRRGADLQYKVELSFEEAVFGIEKEIETSLSRKVWMKSGGYIIIEPTEAMVVIDVNSGRYPAKKEQE